MAEGVRVLLVDDREENLLSLEASLAGLNLNLIRASSGRDALRCCLEQDFAVIVLDVQMPGMDGFETAVLLRERERTRQTPIVFLTALSWSEEEMFRGYTVGAVDYIVKPFAAEILRSKVSVFVELFQANERLRRQSEQLEAANRELEAFSYSVSHDLRAPLASIEGFSRALAEDYAGVLDDTGRGYVQRIRAAAGRMNDLIEDLLKLSRLSRAELQTGPVDLTALGQEVAAGLMEAHPGRKVRFSVQEGLITAGDAAMLRIALENLLGNAWKYTAKQPLARVELGGRRRVGETAFYVRDNGVGFDMARADKLFTPFHRLHSTGDFGGTGIGLATVARVLNRHGGRVWAEAEVGKGATFYFTL